MNKRLIAIIVLGIIQLGASLSMIFTHERVLDSGTLFKFQCAPVDPADLFRGRYVALRFTQREVSGSYDWAERGREAYAPLKIAPDGYVRISELLAEEPEGGDYLRVTIRHNYNDTVRYNLPFDRYYMREDLAPEAEKAYRSAARSGDKEAWVDVRVANGRGVIEELFIDGLPVREYLERSGEVEG